jgi:hypothetical protein
MNYLVLASVQDTEHLIYPVAATKWVKEIICYKPYEYITKYIQNSPQIYSSNMNSTLRQVTHMKEIASSFFSTDLNQSSFTTPSFKMNWPFHIKSNHHFFLSFSLLPA